MAIEKCIELIYARQQSNWTETASSRVEKPDFSYNDKNKQSIDIPDHVVYMKKWAALAREHLNVFGACNVPFLLG